MVLGCAGSGHQQFPRRSSSPQPRGSLIHPLLDIDSSVEFKELRPFKHLIEEFVREKLDQNKVIHVSIYFRDLNNGPWFGIKEREKFSPASLFKVPIMMALFKQAEADPSVLKRKIIFNGLGESTPQMLKPSQGIEAGKAYTLEELIRFMIAYSDNRAHDLILKAVKKEDLDQLFSDLGFSPLSFQEQKDQMSVKDYASFFRILFNASYLNRQMSQKALEFLSQAEFRGLAASVPSGTVVAHKHGERMYVLEQVLQLHDCGIIYYTHHPYLLCVMTRGKDMDNQLEVIRGVSSRVYQEVDRQYRGR
ncbi:MAG: serine hydrolase [Elusimicrobia bacterium]|nr:serine hydrolase [Elusimicrobiota bacterium]